MIKAFAWPHSVFEDVQFHINDARFGGIELAVSESAKALVIDCGSLRNRSEGEITLNVNIQTAIKQVRDYTIPTENLSKIKTGLRLLCKETKFRKFYPANKDGIVSVIVPLNRLRGVATLDVLFLATEQVLSNDDLQLPQGTVIGLAAKPIILALDEDWTGVTIPVDWLPFDQNELPPQGFVHVEFSGGSQIPKVWLNMRFRAHIETTLLRTGDNSPVALAGAALRELFWLQIWEKVFVWAIRNENTQEENWPSTRIAGMWRKRFSEHEWQLPNVDSLEADDLDVLSMRIQHCILTGQNLSRVHGILRFQPEAKGGS